MDPNAAAMGGVPPGQAAVPGNGGMGMSGVTANLSSNPNSPISPQDVLGQAQSIAGQLLTMPEAQRLSELRNLRNSNQLLHSLVRSSLDQMRGQMRSQGQQMLQQQMTGQ